MTAAMLRWRSAFRMFVIAALAATAAGCTTVGVHGGGPPPVVVGETASLQVCVLREASVPDERIEELVAAANEEFEPHGLRIEVPWVRTWERPGFMYTAIVGDLMRRPLEAPCDRLMGLVGRHAGDIAWGMLLPEVLGGVEKGTHTRGFTVATSATIGQLVQTPRNAFIHETYHLLGCEHDLTLRECHAGIAALRRQAQAGKTFFPTVSHDGRLLSSRLQVESLLGLSIESASADDFPDTR